MLNLWWSGTLPCVCGQGEKTHRFLSSQDRELLHKVGEVLQSQQLHSPGSVTAGSLFPSAGSSVASNKRLLEKNNSLSACRLEASVINITLLSKQNVVVK